MARVISRRAVAGVACVAATGGVVVWVAGLQEHAGLKSMSAEGFPPGPALIAGANGGAYSSFSGSADGVQAAGPPRDSEDREPIDLDARPSGRAHLAAGEALLRGDGHLAEQLWRAVHAGDGPSADRFAAAFQLAQLCRRRGDTSQAESLLAGVIAEFQDIAANVATPTPLELVAAHTARDCADALAALRAERHGVGSMSLARDLVLAHRKFFSPSVVVTALMSWASELESSGDRRACLAVLEEAVVLDGRARLSPAARRSLFTRYAGELSRAGRHTEAVAIHETLWAEAGLAVGAKIDVGTSLIESLRNARMHDRRIDVSWDVIRQLDAVLSEPTLGEWDRRSMSRTRQSILHSLTTADAHGRHVDALDAIARLLEETGDDAEREALVAAREGIERDLAANVPPGS